MRVRGQALAVALVLLAGCATGSQGPQPAAPSRSATSPGPASASCPDRSSPDQPGDATQARPALRDWYQLIATDPSAPRVLVGALGFAPEGSGQPSLQSLWAFSTCTNAWSELPGASLPTSGRGLPLAQLVAVPAGGVVLGLPVGLAPVWVLDPQQAAWTEVEASGGGSEEAWPMAVAAPTEGQVLAFDPNVMAADPAASGVLAYDTMARSWTGLSSADPLADAPRVGMAAYDTAYDAAAGLLVLVVTPQGTSQGPAETWVFDPAALSWSRGADVPRTLAGGYPPRGWAAAFDPRTERTWWFADTAMLGYDARADRWTVARRDAGWPGPLTIGGVDVDPTARLVDGMVLDPVNGRLVVVGGWVRPTGLESGGFVGGGDLLATDDVWAYTPQTNTWTMLLAPSDAPASYGPG